MIPFAFPFVTWSLPAWQVICGLVSAGMLLQISQAFYFQALEYSEAGIVAAYWNMTPALLPFAALVVVGSVLSMRHYVGVATLILVSVCFSIVDSNRRGRWRTFFLMLAASFIQVVAILVMKYGFENGTFFVGFLLVTLGIVGAGSAPLLHRTVRDTFGRNMAKLRPAIPMVVGIEFANLIALFMSQKALDLGIPSLVTAVETTIPAYTFALSLLLAVATKRFGDKRASHHLSLKLALVGMMVFGVSLVADLLPA
jgi:drug/metabolite transporter (DMT)-like permease